MKKEKILFCRCTKTEKESLEEEAGKAGMKISAYIRDRIFEEPERLERRKQVEKISRSMDEMLYQVRKIGVNINQIARSNNAGFFNPRDIQDLKEKIGEIERVTNQVYKEVLKEGGGYGDHKTGLPEKR